MADAKRSMALILFPAAVALLAAGLLFTVSKPPGTAVSITLDFARGYVNVTELWTFSGRFSQLERELPRGGVFGDVQIISVSCQGQSYTSYRGQYSASCQGDFPGWGAMELTYRLESPYECYGDLCLFQASFLQDTPVSEADFQVNGANDYQAFPSGGLPVVNTGVSSARLVASVPTYFSNSGSGEFSQQFQELKERYATETRLETGWFVDLLMVASFEAFMAFLFFVFMGVEREVRESGYSPNPPAKRPPHELACLFFPDVPERNVVEATVLSLATRGHLEVTGREMELKPGGSESGFEQSVLDLLRALSKNGKLTLDRDWFTARVEELGRENVRALMERTRRAAKCAPGLVRASRDPKGIYMLMLMQLAFTFLPLAMVFTAPAYLVAYRMSMAALALVNAAWALLTFRRGYAVFSRLNHAAAVERSIWESYRRFARSSVNLDKERNSVDWDYLLPFATLFGLEGRVLSVADRRNIHFTNLYDHHLASNTYHMLLSATR